MKIIQRSTNQEIITEEKCTKLINNRKKGSESPSQLINPEDFYDTLYASDFKVVVKQ